MDEQTDQNTTAPLRRSRRLRQLARQHRNPNTPSSTGRRRAANTNTNTNNPAVHPQPSSLNTETISEDDLCPICQLLIYQPVRTRCNHTLCEPCMATWADISVTSQMAIVSIDTITPPFNPVSLEARCPMCRTQTSASPDSARLANLQSKYPVTYAEREAEERAIRQENGDEVQTLTLSIGNRHRLVGDADGDGNIHEWTFFVSSSRTDVIEEVHIQLHPTFRPSRIIRTRAPYEIRRLGWGTFMVVASVILKAGYSWVSSDAENSPDGAEKGMLGLEWMLDFDGFGGKGSMARLRLKIANQRGWEDISDEEEEDERVWSRLIQQYNRDGRYVPDEEA